MTKISPFLNRTIIQQYVFVMVVVFLALHTFRLQAQDENKCLPEGMIFESQEEIDNFALNYPSCNFIEGSVFIQGNQISNLLGLLPLTGVGAELQISNCTQLIDLQGLNNLRFIGRNDVPLYGLSIEGNKSLTSLSGLDSLHTILGALNISSNPLLTNLDGLGSLDTLGGLMILFNNVQLTDISALRTLRGIGGYMLIDFLPALTSLKGLDNINASTISLLRIKASENLSECDVKSICDYLEMGGLSDINGNATGCNSREEIEIACLTGLLPSGNGKNQHVVFPNPAFSHIRFYGRTAFINILSILDQTGRIVYQNTLSENEQIDISFLPKGLYIIQLKENDRLHHTAFVKM
jgi:hypothetical protein